MSYLIFLACFFTSAFIGYRYVRHVERTSQRRSRLGLYALRREHEQVEIGRN